MSFNSIDYLVFFPIVALLYFAIPKKLKMYWLAVYFDTGVNKLTATR